MKVLPPSKDLQKTNGAPGIQCAVHNGSAFPNASRPLELPPQAELEVIEYVFKRCYLVFELHTSSPASTKYTMIMDKNLHTTSGSFIDEV
ncbi:hypothetical protein RMCBS344292_05257 [Rhizopus microsporus]|nr:hypothetical protein RMCBS344292_05257 [Rhizopus microsporus]